MFSSGGHLGRPAGPVLRAYTEYLAPKESPDNAHIKSFIQPARTAGVHTAHNFRYAPGEFAVTEDHRPIPPESPFAEASNTLARINHYFYRSQQDFERKLQRGRADVSAPQFARSLERFYTQARATVLQDRGMFTLLPELEKLLAGKLSSAGQPVPASGQSFAEYSAAGLALMHQGRLKDAQILLCHAALVHSALPELWILRAMFARLEQKLSRAERFLEQALQLGERPQAYLELARIRMAQQRGQEAERMLLFLNNLLRMRGIMTREWRDILNNLTAAGK
jgi:tetratricopeptide (TPR) repeat protein